MAEGPAPAAAAAAADAGGVAGGGPGAIEALAPTARAGLWFQQKLRRSVRDAAARALRAGGRDAPAAEALAEALAGRWRGLLAEGGLGAFLDRGDALDGSRDDSVAAAAADVRRGAAALHGPGTRSVDAGERPGDRIRRSMAGRPAPRMPWPMWAARPWSPAEDARDRLLDRAHVRSTAGALPAAGLEKYKYTIAGDVRTEAMAMAAQAARDQAAAYPRPADDDRAQRPADDAPRRDEGPAGGEADGDSSDGDKGAAGEADVLDEIDELEALLQEADAPASRPRPDPAACGTFADFVESGFRCPAFLPGRARAAAGADDDPDGLGAVDLGVDSDATDAVSGVCAAVAGRWRYRKRGDVHTLMLARGLAVVCGEVHLVYDALAHFDRYWADACPSHSRKRKIEDALDAAAPALTEDERGKLARLDAGASRVRFRAGAARGAPAENAAAETAAAAARDAARTEAADRAAASDGERRRQPSSPRRGPSSPSEAPELADLEALLMG
ncbi:hypothetical protein M885DRAFT_513031 [Pelagophyceae sp. CCMP2097]|nr:hypothetical protein M885DRAFT_513031 [Pelagophyceae sp. CCMP2097]